MLYTLDEVWDRLTPKIMDVYNIFRDFYGEDYVDLQYHKTKQDLEEEILPFKTEDGRYSMNESQWTVFAAAQSLRADILIWWPRVTVVNDNNNSIDIQDLYAKITVTLEGKIPIENSGFLLNRATYTEEQFAYGYLHSHIQNIPKDDFTYFMQPCLGTGPIKRTINTLKIGPADYDWMLFCQELSMFVQVESLRGGPWRRLEEIMGNNYETWYNSITFDNHAPRPSDFSRTPLYKDFLKWYLENGHLVFSFSNGSFEIGMSWFDYLIDISSSFVIFFNENHSRYSYTVENLQTQGIIEQCKVSSRRFYRLERRRSYNLERYIGKYVCTFKGRRVTISILRSEAAEESSVTTIFKPSVALYYAKRIIEVLNYRYKNERADDESEGTSTTGGTVLYI